MMDFGATSLYLCAMYGEKSVYPKRKTGFVFKPHMNDGYVETFNTETFKQVGNESAIKRKHFTIHLISYFNIYQVKRKLR